MSVQVQQLRRFNSMERRPTMLKDFLSETSNSCSSSGFKSLPRRTPNGVVTPRSNHNSMHSLIEMELKSKNHSYSSSSKSTFQTLINTIRNNISFFTMRKSKSPSMLSLPRSLSRKLSSRRRRRRRSQACRGGCSSEIKISSTVKIKDIIRWKSFRVSSPPLSPSDHLPSTATVTTATCSSSNCSGGSSWSDGDFFTASWEGQNDSVEAGKNFAFSPVVVGKDSAAPCAALLGAKEDLTCQEEEQHSPVSVLQVGEDEFSLFDQSLANIEKRKQKFRQTVQKLESLSKFDLASLDRCLSLDENSYYDEEYEDDDDEEEEEEEEDQRVEEQDWLEERAKQLLHCVKATSSSVQSCDDYLGTVLLDFFKEELTGNRNQNRNGEGFEWEILRIAEDWISGSFDDDVEHVNKDAYIKDMDRRGGWSRFEEEQEELALEIEAAILHGLIADLLDLDG